MLPSRRTQALAVIAMFAAACDIGPVETPSFLPPVVPTLPNPPDVGRLILNVDSREAFVGLTLRLHVAALNTRGASMNTSLSVVTSSNPAVASPSHSEFFQMQYHPGAAPVTEAHHFISMLSAGSAILRVKLGEVTDSVVVTVRSLPLATNVLAVDSFTVIEYRACVTGCQWLIYAPLLKLREPTGMAFADVIAVEFSVPTMSTGLCTTGALHYANGLSAHVNYIDPYIWSNDMILVRLNGIPIPDGPATARIIVRDATGNFGYMEATGTIQRMVSNPDFPPVPFSNDWSCNNRTGGTS